MSGPTSTYGPVTNSGTVTSYLPLTTAWSAPAQCSSLFLDTSNTLFLNAPEYYSVVPGAPECIPPEMSSWWYHSIDAASPTAILLGGYDFLCPEAYTTAFSWTSSSTTTFGCCPSDYDWVGTWFSRGSPNQCTSTIPAGTVTFVQFDSGSTYTTTSQSVSTPSVIWGVQINGFKVPNPQTTAATTTSGGGGVSPSTQAGGSSSSTSSSKLSTGSIIGIVTGSVSMVATVAGLAFKIYKWKHPKRRLSQEGDPKDAAGGSSASGTVEKVCTNCGATTTTQFCTQCGALI